MKRLIILISILLLPVAASAQTTASANPAETCQLAVNKSPVIRGIKLGMKIEDLLRLFPSAEQNEQLKKTLGERTSYPHLGVVNLYVTPRDYSTKAQFAGISGLRFLAIDDRIAEYDVSYADPPDGPSWSRVEDWVAKVAESFDLPPVSNWSVDRSDSERTLRCNGFYVRASNSNLRGNLQIATSEFPYKEQQKRREAFDEKLRHDFKP